MAAYKCLVGAKGLLATSSLTLSTKSASLARPFRSKPPGTKMAGNEVGETKAAVIATGTYSLFGKAARLVNSTEVVGHFQQVLTSVGNLCISSMAAKLCLSRGFSSGPYELDNILREPLLPSVGLSSLARSKALRFVPTYSITGFITFHYYALSLEGKNFAIFDLIHECRGICVIILSLHSRAMSMATLLEKCGIKSVVVHYLMTSEHRSYLVESFKAQDLVKVLVMTNLEESIDLGTIDVVVEFDVGVYHIEGEVELAPCYDDLQLTFDIPAPIFPQLTFDITAPIFPLKAEDQFPPESIKNIVFFYPRGMLK